MTRDQNLRLSKRQALYPEIKRLREDERLSWKEIGARFGLSHQTVCDYYHDPDNSKHKERHRRWQATDIAACERCGGELPGSTARAARRAERDAICLACRRELEAVATQARLEDVACMYREGLSLREIAITLGYSGSSRPPEITECFRRGLLRPDEYRYRAYREAA